MGRSGFTLIGALVSVSIAATLGLTLARYASIGSQIGQSTELRISKLKFEDYFSNTFSNPENCRLGFAGRSSQNPIGNIGDPFQPNSPLMTANSPIKGWPNLKVQNARIQNILADTQHAPVAGLRFWRGNFKASLIANNGNTPLGGNGILEFQVPMSYSTNQNDDLIIDCAIQGGNGAGTSNSEVCSMMGGTIAANGSCQVMGADIRDLSRIQVEAARFIMVRPAAQNLESNSNFPWNVMGRCPSGDTSVIGIRQYWEGNDTASITCGRAFGYRAPTGQYAVPTSYEVNHSTPNDIGCTTVHSYGENKGVICPEGNAVVGMQFLSEHSQPAPYGREARLVCCPRVSPIVGGLYANTPSTALVNIHTVDMSFHMVHENDEFTCPDRKVVVGLSRSYDNGSSQGEVACANFAVMPKF